MLFDKFGIHKTCFKIGKNSRFCFGLTRSQSVSTRSPIVSRTAGSRIRAPGGTTTTTTTISTTTAAVVGIVAKSTKTSLSLLVCRCLGWSILVQSKVINQKLGGCQNVSSIDNRNNIGQKVIQMTQSHSVQHGFIGIPTNDRNGQIGKGQIQSLYGESPNVGIVVGILFGPYIQDVIRHGRIKEGHHANSHHATEWIREYTTRGSQEPTKGIIRRPASGARVKGNSLLVALAETALHVHEHEEAQGKGATVTKACQESIDFHIGLDHVPGPHGVVGTDNLEINAECQNDGGSEPPTSNDWELIEHVLVVVVVVVVVVERELMDRIGYFWISLDIFGYHWIC